MQVTIEIPEQLARQLEPEGERVADIIKRGLRRTWTRSSSLRREVIFFWPAARLPVKLLVSTHPIRRQRAPRNCSCATKPEI